MQDYKGTTKVVHWNSSEGIKAEQVKKKKKNQQNPNQKPNNWKQIFANFPASFFRQL